MGWLEEAQDTFTDIQDKVEEVSAVVSADADRLGLKSAFASPGPTATAKPAPAPGEEAAETYTEPGKAAGFLGLPPQVVKYGGWALVAVLVIYLGRKLFGKK